VEGKKVYEITDQGKAFLEDHRDIVDDIFDRVREAVERTVGGGMADVNRAMKDLMKGVYRTGWRSADEETRRKLADIIRAAVAQVEGLAR
jgi:DNA-binding PadR family transcriptional regulator